MVDGSEIRTLRVLGDVDAGASYREHVVPSMLEGLRPAVLPAQRGRVALPWLRADAEHPAARDTVLARCMPPKSMKCQRPPRTVQEVVRRRLNALQMGWAWDIANCIIYHESRWDRYAVSPTSDYGLWQLNRINLYLLEGRPYYDAEANTDAAIRLYHLAGRSWRPWAVHGRCGV